MYISGGGEKKTRHDQIERDEKLASEPKGSMCREKTVSSHAEPSHVKVDLCSANYTIDKEQI